MDTGILIRKWMEHRSMTPTELAKASGVSLAQISRYKAGASISAANMVKIMDALYVDEKEQGQVLREMVAT